MIVCSNRITYTTEPFSESTEILSNPYQGFYHMIGYTLSDDYIPTDNFSYQTDSYTDSLALVEINLKNYRTTEISETGLTQLDNILTSWSQSPANTKLILRFLYDWDGLALATEPESLDLILTHMDQISTLINRHCDSIYVMQGIFIGNWGEMHHSHFMDDSSVKTLIQHLHDTIDPSIYLSVRTPAQWRMINNLYDLPQKFPAFGADNSLIGRLGLFNDGMLGSESDLGTYGNTARRDATSPSYQGTRKEELEFQNNLCSYVPNGGEVIYNNNLSDLETSVSALRAMHVSYLNADYDSRVLEKWRNTVWTGNDAFYGCDGYSYVQAHLGYRYLIRTCKIKKSGWIKPELTLTLTLQNNGFSNTLKPFQTSILLKNTETGTCTIVPFDADLRKLGNGQKKSFSVKLPVQELERGSYQIYFSAKDETSGQMILLGNTNKVTDEGYLIGQLEK
ncbi:MAG: DUF4832 domain-containing protein [Mediterraneibacter faecis]|nr:DUF4832 domain-containing protein [Mediterraneibacter faecis]